MRSHLAVLSIISLAMAGCGKSTDRTASPTSLPQNGMTNPSQTTPVETRAGYCHDTIVTNFKRIERFSDISAASGNYALVGFEAVGTATEGAVSAISSVSVNYPEGGALEYTEICRDLNAMPSASFSYTAAAPTGIEAKTGAMTPDVRLDQTVFGPGVMNADGSPRASEKTLTMEMNQGCADANAMVNGKGCEPAMLFQIDSNTIGVLRKVETTANGMKVNSKIFAKYVLKNGEVTLPMPETPDPVPAPKPQTPKAPKPSKPSKPSTPKVPSGAQGSGAQGSVGQTSSSGSSSMPTPSCSSPTSNSGHPTSCFPPMPSRSVGDVKAKLDVKHKENKSLGIKKDKLNVKMKTDSGDESSKTKLDVKHKENGGGIEKDKLDYKFKEDTDSGSTKIKTSIKVKSS